MNILIISASYYPIQSPRSFRTYELARELSEKGHNVSLLVPKINNDSIHYSSKYKIKHIELNLNHNYITSNSSIFKNRILSRVMLKLFDYPSILYYYYLRNYSIDLSNIDAVISIAVPYSTHWGVSRWKTKFSFKWIADCGDPYYGFGKKIFQKAFYLRWFSDYCLSKSDYITVPIEGAKKAYNPKLHSKIKIIPQGVRIEEYLINKSFERSTSEIQTIGYAGSFIPNRRDPRPFIDHILSKKYKFKFIVYTKDKSLLAGYANKYPDKIEIKDYVPRNKLIKELSQYSFLVNFDNKNTVQLPSKLIDYALSDRPILSVDSYNINDKVVSEFFSGNYGNRTEVDLNKYDISVISDQFLGLIK